MLILRQGVYMTTVTFLNKSYKALIQCKYLGWHYWMLIFFCDVLLTVHLSIFISVTDQLDAQNFCFTISFISCLYMFRAHVLIIRRIKITLHSLWYRHSCRWPSRARVAVRSNTVTMIAETETRFCWPKVLRCQTSGRQSAVITVRPTNTFLSIYSNRYKQKIRPKYGSFPYRYQNKQLTLPGMNNTHTGIMECTL